MTTRTLRRQEYLRRFSPWLAVAALTALAGSYPALAQDFPFFGFLPGNLVVSRSVYDNNPNNVIVGQTLPPNCVNTTANGDGCVTAKYNGIYPQVFNNAPIDSSFGITSKIFLDQITFFGFRLNSLQVPNGPQGDHLVTSFSSKSELGLHLSADGQYLTFMGYVLPIDALDVSNSNTPLEVDPSNPVPASVYRAVAQVDRNGKFQFTETNAYSGNNGRAAILNNNGGADVFFTAGNAGNGSTPQPNGIILGAGAQIITPSRLSEASQSPTTPTPVASFSATEISGNPADKIGKDDNFRGIAIYNNVLYYTKGSGGNGVNTVYFVDTVGGACPNGVGVPQPGAKLPTMGLVYSLSTLQADGLPNNMCILGGFPTTSNKVKNFTPTHYPFAIWFANPATLYVADEGDGYAGGTDLYTHAAAQTLAGLQKWVFDASTKTWNLAYTLQNGLNLGTPYTVSGYPSGNNPGTATKAIPDGLPWSPATDGLRNMTGQVLGDWVAIWAITSTISGSGDQGADPNKLVAIVDSLSNTDPTVAAKERFFTLQGAGFGEVLRGVSFAPGNFLDLGGNE